MRECKSPIHVQFLLHEGMPRIFSLQDRVTRTTVGIGFHPQTSTSQEFDTQIEQWWRVAK